MATPREYPDELRERATRLAVETRETPRRLVQSIEGSDSVLASDPKTGRTEARKVAGTD